MIKCSHIFPFSYLISIPLFPGQSPLTFFRAHTLPLFAGSFAWWSHPNFCLELDHSLNKVGQWEEWPLYKPPVFTHTLRSLYLVKLVYGENDILQENTRFLPSVDSDSKCIHIIMHKILSSVRVSNARVKLHKDTKIIWNNKQRMCKARTFLETLIR